MAETNSRRRPGVREVRIDDCRGAVIFDNPTVRCPHGLRWRESDHATAPKEIAALMCKRDECAAIEYYPHADEHIVLRIPRSFKARQPIMELVRSAARVSEDVATRIAASTSRSAMRDIIVGSVVEWGWTDGSGVPLPLPSSNWDLVASECEAGELWWIVNAVAAGGELSAVAEQSGNGGSA